MATAMGLRKSLQGPHNHCNLGIHLHVENSSPRLHAVQNELLQVCEIQLDAAVRDSNTLSDVSWSIQGHRRRTFSNGCEGRAHWLPTLRTQQPAHQAWWSARVDTLTQDYTNHTLRGAVRARRTLIRATTRAHMKRRSVLGACGMIRTPALGLREEATVNKGGGR